MTPHETASRHRIWWVVGILGTLAGAALATWLGLAGSLGQVTWNDIGYDVVDDRTVTVDFDVHRPRGQAAVCTVRALDQQFGTVGSLEVTIPASDDHSVHRSVTIRTTTLAVSGHVKECHEATP